MQFKELNLISPLLAAVKAVGYTTPSPIQQKTIPLVLAGRDVLGCAQTGTGKTAAFALPMLQQLNSRPPRGKGHPIRALILTPTRELAIQIGENFDQYGGALPLKTAVIFGGVNQNPQVAQLKKGVDILVATPGRLNDLVGQGFIRLDALEIFVLDEADRMLDMGFIHDVRKVIKLLPPKERRQTLLFSATMPKEVEELALQLLDDPATVKISPVTSTVDKIAQSVYFAAKEDKPELLLWLLKERRIDTALVFTRTKHGADQVARKLNRAGVQAMAIHGNKSQNARQAALGQFKAGTLRVLVATDIAARGIDVAELPFVINYNIPDTPEAYIHRIGRTGRAGMEGQAISLCCSDELKAWWDIEKHTKQSVPVGECPWSVTDMQPTQAPPPGSNRNRQQPAKKAEKQPEKAPQKPQKPVQEKSHVDQKGKNTKQESRPRAQQTTKQEKKQPAKQPPKQSAQPKEKAPEKRRESERETPRSTPYTSSYSSSYAARYGTSRPVRPFQSRSSFSQPRAEDFPPPPPTGGSGRDFDIHVLPEMSPLRTNKPLWEAEDYVVEVESAKATETPAAETSAAPKKRRHRGGRRHRKPSSGKTE